MNGSTHCPHCDTRFKITEAQLTAYQGMVRCGRCMQAFDARPTYHQAPSDSVSAEDEYVDQDDIPDDEAVAIVIDDHSPVVPEVTLPELVTEPGTDFVSIHLPLADFHTVDLTEPLLVASDNERGVEIAGHHLQNDDVTSGSNAMPAKNKKAAAEGGQVVVKRRMWLTGIALFVALLLAQTAYFFRVSLAMHVPFIKPALVRFCQVLNCSVPLPQHAALISIESSGLEADQLHQNQIVFNALLRNRAGITLSFPQLALTLNDNQDMPQARRFIEPRDYLPSGENVLSGFSANHELSVKLHLNIGDLRPAGYRLELFDKK